MFSGIIQQVGKIKNVIRDSDGSGRLVIETKPWNTKLALGESIANNGVCLTITDINLSDDKCVLSFDLLNETFVRTNLGDLKTGDPVNLERALGAGELIGGHFVTGHVDGVGTTTAWEPNGRDFIWRISCSREMALGMVPKGSIACDGISLTIVDLDNESFSVHIIPHTVENTNLCVAKVGQQVNLETDMIGKYVARLVNNDK